MLCCTRAVSGIARVAARCKQALIDRAPSAMNAQVTTLLANVVY
jgi:hypothetical protein